MTLRQRAPRKRNKAYLGVLARCPSVISGKWPVQVAHLRMADPARGKPHTGIGEKPSDMWCLPLTPEEHAEQHSMSERAWWERQGIDPVELCLRLYDCWRQAEDRIMAEKRIGEIIFHARNQRLLHPGARR